MADVITGASSELDATKATLIASMVQKELAFKAKLTQFVTDVSSMAQAGAKQINFPKLSSFTVVNRAEGAHGDSSVLTATADTLLLDKNAYVSWIIDSMTAAQSNIQAELEFAKFAAAAQARYVDTQIIAKLRTVCSYFANVGTDADVTYAQLVALMQKIEEANGDTSSVTWLISPQQKAALFNIAEIKNWNQFGQANMPSGVIGEILGAPVVVHNGLAGKELFLVEKTGLAIGFQKAASYGEESALSYGVGAKKAAIDQLFGVAGMQLNGSSKSPLIVGLND